MVSIFLMLLYLIGANGFWVLVSHKTFGKCLPITFMFTAFTYFFSQVIFHTFKIGFGLNILLVLCFLVLLLIKLKQKEWQLVKNNLFSNGFYVFLVVYLGVIIFDFNRTFTMWDEFSHWGEMVKEMFRLDQLYTVNASSLQVHKDYPPIVQVLELFFCHLKNAYDERTLIQTVHLFSLSLFIPFFSEEVKLSKKSLLLKGIFISLSIFLIELLFDQHAVINTIYTDYLMAILVAYLLGKIIIEKDLLSNFNLFSFSLGLSFLLLTKQMGLPFYLMILFLWGLKFIKNKDWKQVNWGVLIKAIILLIFIPLLIYFGWSRYVNKLNVTQQFDLTHLNLTELPDIMAGLKGEEWQRLTITNYQNALMSRSMTTSYIALNYWQVLILILLLLFVIWQWGRIYLEKSEIVFSALTLVIGAVGYALVMFVLYVFLFGPSEGPELASFNRYLPTYSLMGCLFVYFIFIFVDMQKSKLEFKNIMFVFGLLVLVQGPSFTTKCIPKLVSEPLNFYQEHASIISQKTPENAKIFIVANNTKGDYQYYTKYYMNPRFVNLEYYNLALENDNYVEYFENILSPYLLNYDYLYLAVIDEEFINHYQFMFDNLDISTGNLYKIVNKHGIAKLENA